MSRTKTRVPRWCVLQKYVIPDIAHPDQPYLVRWRVVQTPWFAIYLHKICLPDTDRHMHDHPWPFVSIVLRGGYEEQLWPDSVWNPARRRGWLSVGFRRATALHRITRLFRTPTWTLVFVGPRRRTWGYRVPGGAWIDHDTYHREHWGIGAS